MHEDPPEQIVLHPPQFQLSRCVSTQLLLQYNLSGGQRETHLPIWQY
jgi:hypothetical protein